jgi:cell division septation protein DedD
MDDENRRGKEYYQVNLDTGRIFWIAFALGLVLIAIFFFGFLIGGEEREGPLQLSDLKIFGRGQEEGGRASEVTVERTKGETTVERSEYVPAEEVSADGEKERAEVTEDDRLSELLETDLDAETRYIEVESIDEAIRESERRGQPEPEEKHAPSERGDEPYVKAHDRRAVAQQKAPAYRAEGIYYIQVASFTKEKNARAFAQKLRDNMYKVSVEEAVVNDKTFHRVRVGPFERRSVAVNTMVAMKRLFKLKDPFVVAKPT